MDLQDYDGRTALHLAAAENKLEAVKYLVKTAKVKISIPDRYVFLFFYISNFVYNKGLSWL